MILLISVILFFSILLVISFIKNRQEKIQLNNKLLSYEAALKNSNESEQTLRQDLSRLTHSLKDAIEDPVTHLLGRELFEDRLKQSIKESTRYQLTLAILFIDIDEFKNINLALGYEAGDELLVEISKRLQTCIRQVDSIARFSKDTFVCLLTQLAKPETAAIVAQRMLQALSLPFEIKEQDLYLTAAIGISIYPTDGEDSASLIRNSEYALKLAKTKGKQTYQFYHERTHINSQRELALLTRLNNGSLLNEMVLYYQPIINTEDESLFCMDVLLKWQHPHLGMIHAEELSLYAEKQDKLNQLSEWMLKTAAQQLLKWRALDFVPKYLGFPLSIKQLEASQFVYRISQILQSLQFKPEWLLLEIRVKETQLSFDVLDKALNMLKYLGIQIAINEFDNSPFLLAYLKKITINYLKLSQFIIDDMDVNPMSVALVKSLVYLAQQTSIQLIVQGVESSNQIDSLKKLGCHLMQGPFFCPPLPGEEIVGKMLEIKIEDR